MTTCRDALVIADNFENGVDHVVLPCRTCGGDKTLDDVPDEDFFEACELTDLMGVKAIEMLDKAKAGK